MVDVRLSRLQAQILAAWLRDTYASASLESAEVAMEIAGRLTKAAVRKRSTSVFEIAFQRGHAAWFASLRWWLPVDDGDITVPEAVRRIVPAFQTAMRRGRPRLSRSDRSLRASGEFQMIGARQVTRNRRQLRIDAKWDAFIEQGMTILGDLENAPREI